MRITLICCLLIALTATNALAQGGRYGTADSAASSVPNPFDSASRYGAPAATSKAAANSSNSLELKPLSGNSTNRLRGSNLPPNPGSQTTVSNGGARTAAINNSGRQFNQPATKPTTANNNTGTITQKNRLNNTPSQATTQSQKSNDNRLTMPARPGSSSPTSAYSNNRTNLNRSYTATPSSSQASSAYATNNNRSATIRRGVREQETYTLLTNMLKAHSRSQLRGTPTSLSAIVSQGGGREKQSQIVDAYWALSSATTDYYLGLHEADEFNRLKQRVSTNSQVFNEAVRLYKRRVSTSLMAAKAAQIRLGKLTGSSSQILPTDTPFCGHYATRYQQIFASNPSEEARLLKELLPLRLSELEDAAKSVERLEKLLDASKRSPRTNAEVKSATRDLELLALNRRALVMITRDYNLQINRYAQLASPGNISSGRLVAMLIRKPTTASQASNIASNRTFSNEGQTTGLRFQSGAAATASRY